MARVRAGKWMVAAVVGLAAGLSGCQRSPFPPDAARTPYERYMVLRGQYRPRTEPGPYGGEKPSLRQRLRPMSDH